MQLSELVDLPASPEERCRLAERFLDEWLPQIRRTDHTTADDVPIALAWAHARFGQGGARLFVQDPLVPLDDVRATVGDLVPFRREQQGVVEWGYRADDGPDPEVLVRPGDADAAWEPHQDSLSVHLLEGVLTETTLAGAHAANVEASDAALESLRDLQPLGIPRHPFWGGAGDVAWYGMEGAVVRNDADTWLWAVARTSDELSALTGAVPGEWAGADDQNS